MLTLVMSPPGAEPGGSKNVSTGVRELYHVREVETSYSFSSYEKLLPDFWADVDAWDSEDEDCDARSCLSRRCDPSSTPSIQR